MLSLRQVGDSGGGGGGDGCAAVVSVDATRNSPCVSSGEMSSDASQTKLQPT